MQHRIFLEKKAQEKLARSMNEYQEKARLVKAMIAKRNEYADNCSAEKKSGMDGTRYRWYHLFFQKINADLEAADRILKKTDADILLNRKLLLRETIRKKTLEKLRKVRLEQYVMSCAREEQKALDETVIHTKQ